MPRLFLVGPMGAGKTTLGKLVAADLGYDFVDSDRVIEERTGVDIPTIFHFEGEEGFRKREARVIDELTQMDNIVLATGGGAILREENRVHLHNRGFVVYLKVSVQMQLLRTSRDRNRPLLNNDNPELILIKLAAARTPLYEEVAHCIVDTDHSRTRSLRNQIIHEYKTYRKSITARTTPPNAQESR